MVIFGLQKEEITPSENGSEYNVSTVAKSGTVTFNAPLGKVGLIPRASIIANKALNNIVPLRLRKTELVLYSLLKQPLKSNEHHI